MGNIVLLRLVIFVYIVLCLVFLLSPYLGGKDKRFGLKVKKDSKTVRVLVAFYNISTLFSALVFAMISVSKGSFVFVNILAVLYIVMMSAIYLKIRQKLKELFDKNIFREIIINNPPSDYIMKGINPAFYIFYIVPVAVSFFVGKNNSYMLLIVGIQLLIPVLAYTMNFLICKFKNYVDDDIDESVKKNMKYRKLWNINGYFVFLAMSATITVMYMEYMRILRMGAFGNWLPFVCLTICVIVLVVFSLRYLKK